MLKSISLLAILAITISFGVQYADAHEIHDHVDHQNLQIENLQADAIEGTNGWTITLTWAMGSWNNDPNPPPSSSYSCEAEGLPIEDEHGNIVYDDDGNFEYVDVDGDGKPDTCVYYEYDDEGNPIPRAVPPENKVDPNNGFSIDISKQGEFIRSVFIPEEVGKSNYTFTESGLTSNTEYTFAFTVYDCDYDGNGENPNVCEANNEEYHSISDKTINVTTKSNSENSSSSDQPRRSQSSEQQSESEIPEAEYGGQQSEQQSESEIPEAEYGGQPESKVSEPESITLNVSAFSDSNGNGIQDEDESPLSNLMLLVYTPDTGILDVIYTKTDGTISKSDFTTNSFYVIAHPKDGYTSSTHQFSLDDTTIWGVLYVENPQIGSTYDMNVGITQDLQ